MNGDANTRAFGVRNRVLLLLAACSLLAVAGLVTSRVFVNRLSVRTFRMTVAPDGQAPWGVVGPEWENGPAPVVLYRKVNNSYCYTALRSPELRERALNESLRSVPVEYNVFSNFGRVGRYTLRTVDGQPFAIGNKVIRETQEFGGRFCWTATMLRPASSHLRF
jgi:hypothetical protein